MSRIDKNAIIPVSIAMLAAFAVVFGVYMIFVVYHMNIDTRQIQIEMKSVKKD